MKRFKLITATASALIVSLVLAASVAAASNPSQDPAPSDLSAEVCGDQICLFWTPGSDAFAHQQVAYWQTSNPHNRGSHLIHPNAAKDQVKFSHLNLPSSFNSDTISYTFQVVGIGAEAEGSGTLAYSNLATVAIPVAATFPLPGIIEEVPNIGPITPILAP